MGLDYIQKLITGIDPFGNKTTAVFSAGGVVAGHFDEGRLGKNIRDSEKDMAGPYLDALYTAVNTGQFFNYTIYDSALKTNLHVFAVPFPIGKTGTPWTLALAVSEKAAMAPISRLVSLSILICGIIVVVIAAAAFFFSRSISKPIVHTVEMLKDISNGEGDLTQTIESTSADEIGDLGHYFNQTLDKIKNLVITIKKQADRLSDIGNDLASNMTESAAAVNEIASNINSIKQRVINQSGSVNQTNAAMERITDNIGKLNQHVEEQSAGVSGSSASIEEMLANIQSVTRTLIKNEDNVKALSEASEVGRNSLQEVSADIQEIARESAGLLEINAVMENIASQTNLLSMNAAIEAAHAGEVGKGFAVVADEIRKLAESSSEQSKTISSVLKKIKNSIDKITESTNNVLNKFEAIDQKVRTVAQQEGDIRSAMEEQSAGSKQILDSIAGLNEITQQVKKGSTEMFDRSKEVIQESKSLAEETQEIAGGMNEMAAGADQINVAINHISELSGQNRDNIAILIREVSRFKVE
jgi:methyl-accepting chemotaxis protein